MQRHIDLQTVNPYLICALCDGYLIDATTLVECLHSFCRSCLIKYLESSYNCPKCNTEIHKTKPLEYIRSDPCLQEIVYKLVPNLFNGEESRKRQWNLRMINVDEPGPSTTCIKDNAIDSRILVTLKYFRGTSRLERLKAEKVLQLFPTRYLCCQPEMPVRVLKKFVQQKYDISPSLFEIDIWRGDETLLAEITLTQLIQIYGLYRERKPLELHFSLYPKFTPKKESEESGSEKLLELRTNSEKSYIEGKGVETEKIEMDNVYAQNTQVSIKNGAPLNETDKDSTIVSESETSVEMTAPSSSARNKESNDPEEEQLANNIIHNPPPDSSDEKKPCG